MFAVVSLLLAAPPPLTPLVRVEFDVADGRPARVFEVFDGEFLRADWVDKKTGKVDQVSRPQCVATIRGAADQRRGASPHTGAAATPTRNPRSRFGLVFPSVPAERGNENRGSVRRI